MEKLEKKEEVRPRDWKLIAACAGLGVIIVIEFFLRKAGWFVLPTIMLGYYAWQRIQAIKEPERDFIRIKSVKPRKDGLH